MLQDVLFAFRTARQITSAKLFYVLGCLLHHYFMNLVHACKLFGQNGQALIQTLL